MWCVYFAHLYHFYQYSLCFTEDLIMLNVISRYMTSTGNFCKKQRHCRPLKSKFCRSKLFIQCNTGNCCVYITDTVNIYIYVCINPLLLVCPVCLSVCMISNQSTSKNHVTCFKPSVNLNPYCRKHYSTKAPKLNKLGPYIVKQNNTTH